MNRIFNFFKKHESVRAASIILIITLMISNVLGLLRDRFLAKNIATSTLDIYYASFRIPDLIFNFLILGAITSAFIPVFSDFLARKKEEEAFEVANTLINLAFIAMSGMALLVIVFMPYLMPLVVPSFDQARLDQAVTLSRLLMLTPIFFSVSYITGGILNCYKRFISYAIAPLVYNLAIIIGAAFLAPRYGIIGVVYMVVAGSALHLLVQLPSAIRKGYRYRPLIKINEPIIRIIRLMFPRTISMGANQIMLLVYTAIASALAAGSIAAFELSNNIQTMPVVVLGTSFATAIFPTLARKISEGNEEEFAFYLNRALRAIGFLLIPSTAIFILLRAQIVRLILGSGKFGWDDTKLTALTLGFFAISILAQGLIPLLSRAFYALKDTKTPMYISLATVVFSIGLAWPLSQTIGVAGLALAFSIASYFNVIALVFFLRRLYPGILDRALINSYLKTFSASLVMAFAVWGTIHFVAGLVDMSRFWGVMMQTISAVFVGVGIFFAASYFFEQEEMKWAFTRKINGEKQ